jgi:hypothetical protein
METGRREIVMEAEVPSSTEFDRKRVPKLTEEVDEATALSLLKESRGWQIVLNRFIEPRLSRDRILQAKTSQERAEVWGAVGELDELVKFIEGRIKDGQKANEQLEAIKKRRG